MRAVAAVGLAAALLATACGDEAASVAAADAERIELPATRAAEASDAISDFGWDLYRALAVDEANVVFSPHSIGVALAMTRVGAGGETAAELDAVLGVESIDTYEESINALDLAFAASARTVELSDGTTADVELDSANALWAQDGFRFEDAFLTALAESHGAGVHLVDYAGENEAARLEINSWVADRTSDRIDELILPGVLSALTRLVLTNAVYFRAPWEHPFEPEATNDGIFTRLDGAQVTVELMATSETFRYGRVGETQAIELPYAGGELSMLLLVPDEGTFGAVSSTMDRQQLETIVESLAPAQVDLALPRFEFTTHAGLVPVLRSLGVSLAFDPDLADFSAMTTEGDLYVSDVVHEAFIAVDEAGTEAAAATAVVMDLTAAPGDTVALTVDRPFLLLLRHGDTNGVLFVGHVVDP